MDGRRRGADRLADVARLFDAGASTYDELEPWYVHLYERLHALLLARIPPARPGARSLDVGCGTGFQTALLDALGYESHGVDIAPGLLAVTRRRLPASTLALASAEALPYRAQSFDAASCCGSTLSFLADPALALREIARVLRPGGRLLLECEHRWSLDLLWALASAVAGDALGYGVTLTAAWRQMRPGSTPLYADYPCTMPDGTVATMRLRLFTAPELGRMLRDAGLRMLATWGLHSATNVIPSTVLHRPRLGRIAAVLFRALRAADRALSARAPGRWLANSLVVLAEKRA